MKNRITRRSFIKRAGVTLAALSGVHISVGHTAQSLVEQQVPFSSGNERPKINVPFNATDCHHHIYDSRFPIDSNSALRPLDATISDYRLLQKRLGIMRNVVVQPSTYGVNNSGLIEVLKLFGTKTTRGIAVVNTSVSDDELKLLHAVGVRGIRFNLSVPGGATNMDMVEPLAERINDFGWHIQVVARANDIVNGADIWSKVPCPVVFDHLGHVPSVDHPAFDVICRLLQDGKGWVKLSGAYILTKDGPPNYEDRSRVAKAYVAEAPERLVWGSDWPHPTAKVDNKPDDAILLDLLAQWAPDESIRDRILVKNPSELYGFS